MRTNRKQLEVALDCTTAELAYAVCGLPQGSLRLETWSPGDGVTRYRVMFRDAEGIDWECGPYHHGAGAMADTLATLRAVAWRIASDKRKHRAKLAEMAGEVA